MNSTPNFDTSHPDAVGPNKVLAARADERLAHAYEQIARADEQLAHVTAQLSKLGHDAARDPAAVPGRGRGRPVLRGLVGLGLAAGIGAAAYASQSEAARPTIAQWAPFLLSTSSPWLAKPGNAAQPNPPAIQLASADATAPQAIPSAQIPAQGVAPKPAPLPPELTELLQSMARDIATVEQGVEQLKASQQQMVADNARAIEELKAGQQQATRLAARPPVQDQRAKTPVPASPPVASATRKPAPTAQARARAPVQLLPGDE